MSYYESLYRISKLLQIETRQDTLPRTMLEQVIAHTGAHKGFIVVKEEGSFQEKYHVHFDRDLIPARKRRFSRTLIREAITTRAAIFSEDITKDTRFVGTESVMILGSCSVMVTPLEFKDQVEAVIYMEKRDGEAPFTPDDQAFMKEFSQLAGFAIHRVLELETLARLKRIHERDFLNQYHFEGIIGRNPKITHLLETVVQVAKSDATALLIGETGTGKELIARAVYQNSQRADKPYITLHCGAMPETLFESELFGHKKGSFTGAHQDRSGRIAQAKGGTLFLDEVAEIPLATQAKLLRFIQFGEFQRVGSDHLEKVDIRLIAATHKDLAQMVEDGTFRQDLYFRLNVLELEIPPLRERKSDIPLLVDYFLKKYWKRDEKPRLSNGSITALERYAYPGNVRELAHIVERMCVLARGPLLEASLLPKNLSECVKEAQSPISSEAVVEFSSYSNDELKAARDHATREAVAQVEKTYLQGLLKLSDGNITRAAERAGMQRPYLHRLLAKYRED